MVADLQQQCRLADAGISINCFGSAVANWGWEPLNDDHFNQTREQLVRAIARMKKLNCTMLRGMSFKAQWERPAWDAEIENLAFSAKLMTFECGMRFLTDYLEGDVYFRTTHAEHNIIRARNQFKLVADMEAHMDEMNVIVSKYKEKYKK